MRNIVVFILLSIPCFSFGQVAKGAGVFYFNGEPTLVPNLCYDSEIGIDTTTGYWWEYSRDLSSWILAGFRIQEIEGCAAPTYTPVDKQSEIVLNGCDSLYRFRGGSWYLLNKSATANVYYPGSGIYFTGGDTINAIDTSATNEAWTISDGTNTELIIDQTVVFTGSGGAVVSYSPSTNTVTINAGSSTGGDNWGTQVAQTNASLSGDGTSGSPLGITDYTGASIGMFPSKSSGGILWQTVDLSATNELQTLNNTSNATSHTATLSNSGGSIQFVEGSGITLATTGTGLDGILTVTAVDASITNEALTISDGTDSENLGGQTLTVSGAGITTVDYVPATNTLTIASTEVDGSTSNELQTYSHSGTTSYTNTLSNGGGSFTLQSGGIVTLSHSAGTTTISATEVDGSVTNELQTLSNTSNPTSHTTTLSNSGGSTQFVEGSGITLATTGTGLDGILTITAVDASATNELQTYSHSGTISYTNTLSNGGGSFTLQSGGIIVISNSSGTVTISATEVDGSITNEGILGVAAGTGTTSIITSNTSTANGVTLAAGGIINLSESTSTNGGTITISATEVDGSTSNELQTLASTSNATSHTVTLSNSGGSIQLVEGSGITLTTSGTGLDGIVTIAAVDASTTNESLTISDGTDSENLGGQTLTVSATGIATVDYVPGTNTLSIGAVEVDGSTSNEIQTYGHSGTTSYTNTLSLGGGSFTLQSGGIVTLSHSAGTTTISATEVDGSTTNELQTLASTSNATSHTVTLSNSGGSIQLVEGSGITLTTSGTGLDGIVTIASTSGAFYQLWKDEGVSATQRPNANFLQSADINFTLSDDVVNTETEVSAVVLTNAIDYNQIQQVSASRILGNPTGSTANVSEISLAAGLSFVGTALTPADASATNELQTLSNTSNATSHTTTLSNSGGSTQFVEGSGITLSTSGTGLDGILTITAVDASTTNEALTVSDGTDSEALGGQTLTFAATGIATVDYVPGTNTLSIGAVEVDGSISNEGSLTVAAGTGTTSIINSNTSGSTGVTLTAAGILIISESGNVITLTATEVDGSTTNEVLTVSDGTDSEALGGQTLTFAATGIATVDYVPGTNTLSIGAVEVDGSTSNEIQTYGHSGTTSYTNTLSLGGGSFTLQSGGIVTLSHSAGTTTISATEVDGSVTNELQTLSNTSNATSHTTTLSNSGGSTQFVEGSGITLATSGTGLDGILTITAVDASTTNEALTVSDGTDSEALGGQTLTFAATGIATVDYVPGTNTLSIGAVEVDGNISNEGSLTVAAGTGTTSIINSNTSGQTGVTLTAAGVLTISESGNVITLTATEVDGSTTNELQTLASTSNATSHTVTLSNSGGSIQLVEGTGITLTTSGTGLNGIVTIASTGAGITAANNGLYVSGGTTVRLGTNPLIEATIIDHDGFDMRHADGKWSHTDQTTSYTPQGAAFGVEGTEAVPTINSTPTKDGIIELRASLSGSAQPNSLTIGAYPTDADGIWIQARSQAVPNFEYPISMQPRGGQLSVGRINGLDALVTFAGTGLSGSGIAGQVLHLENNEGNGKTSMSLGAGTDALDSEVAWFDASDALRITNRSNVTGTSTVRIAVGGETSDKVIVTNAGMGVGSTVPTAILSTLQVEGSLGLQTSSPGSSTTLTAANNVLVFLGSSNATFTLPTASTVDGRVYWIMNHSASSTVTLSIAVTKANGSTFTVINPGQTALIVAVIGNGWRGSLWTSQ